MAIRLTGTEFHPSHVPLLSVYVLGRIQFSRARRSAARAQKIFSRSKSGPGSALRDTTAQTERMIKTVKRRRKQRHHQLREMIQSSGGDAHYCSGRGEGGAGEIVCPVCLERVFGDPDVTEAHVDACLFHVMPSAHEEAEIDIGGPSRTRVTDGANLIGLIHPSLDYRSTIEPSLCSLRFPC